MHIGVPKEISSGEQRVATTPEAAKQLQKLGFSVSIEAGAGISAKLRDDDYRDAGVAIVDSAEEQWKS